MAAREIGVAFTKGDIVQLKAGGPAMIVTGQSGESVEVLWYGEMSDDIKKASVPEFCLVEAEIEEAEDEPLGH